MEFTALQIADLLNGTVQGNNDVLVSHLSKIEDAKAGALSFLANPKYTPYVYTTGASVTLVSSDFKPDNELTTTLVLVDDPYNSFTKLLSHFAALKQTKTGVHKHSSIDSEVSYGKDFFLGAFSVLSERVNIGDNVKIHHNVHIGADVSIGDNTIIYSGANIADDTIIGANCIIHSNAVIGADGFGFSPNKDGSYSKIPQTGNVVIEDDVEVGSNTTIDRATLGSTIIRKGVKLDNLVQIAHNVEIGSHTVIAAQSGVAGSTKIGSNCVLGGQVGVGGHLKVGDRVQVQAQTGVLRSIPDDSKLMGTPAFDYNQFSRSYVHFKNLPKHINTLHELQKKLNK